MRCIVVINPQHEYACELIERAFNDWQLPTVAVYTSRRELLALGWQFPLLYSDRICASYLIDPSDMREVACQLAAEWDIVAVIPTTEPDVQPAADLLRGLSPNDPRADAFDAFGAKMRLRSTVLAHPDAPRVNRFWPVSTSAEIRQALNECRSEKFVVKPDRGYGNVGVGIFDRTVTDSELDKHLAQADEPMMMEEFNRGQEYHVNGEVDAMGNVSASGVFKYQRGEANGVATNMLGEERVSSTEEVFAPLIEYTKQFVRATGLIRSPFHAEVIFDEQGPCVVDIGARLVGGGIVYEINASHEGTLDAFSRALECYVSDQPASEPDVDWTLYDAVPMGVVVGHQPADGRIKEIVGIDIVEARHDFEGWAYLPKIGSIAHSSKDLTSHAYRVILRHDTAHGIVKAAEEIRNTISVNLTASSRQARKKYRRAIEQRIRLTLRTVTHTRPKRLSTRA